MEQSKRERLILFGVIPVVSAIIGAIATVVVGHYFGGAKPSEVMVEIIKMQGVSPADKAKLMELANAGSQRFYSLLGSVVSIVSLVCGVLVWAVADWIRKR